MPFIAYSCLLALAKTSNGILIRDGESKHPCLLPKCGARAVNQFFSYKYYAGSKLLYNPHHVVYIPLCLIFVKFYIDEFYCTFFSIEMR